MRRTQLYLDDQLWSALHALARSQQTTVSELVRQAARERYLSNPQQRMAAMQRFVGSRKIASPVLSAAEEIRSLRRGRRLGRLSEL